MAADSHTNQPEAHHGPEPQMESPTSPPFASNKLKVVPLQDGLTAGDTQHAPYVLLPLKVGAGAANAVFHPAETGGRWTESREGSSGGSDDSSGGDAGRISGAGEDSTAGGADGHDRGDPRNQGQLGGGATDGMESADGLRRKKLRSSSSNASSSSGRSAEGLRRSVTAGSLGQEVEGPGGEEKTSERNGTKLSRLSTLKQFIAAAEHEGDRCCATMNNEALYNNTHNVLLLARSVV